MKYFILLLFFFIFSGFMPNDEMIKIPTGKYVPFYQKDTKQVTIPVKEFYMDKYAVTNAEYLQFVKANPEWTKSQVNHLFADDNYLKYWVSDFDIGPDLQKIKNSPVTNVSWFAANAYAQWKHKRIPTTDEWEYAAAAGLDSKNGGELTKIILEWYQKPNPAFMPPAGSTFRNQFGLYDMHGLVWEWVYDFNQPLADGTRDIALYCSNGSLKTANEKDYASYMRYAFRSSLRGNYCINNLGFRCAHNVNQ